MGPCPPAALSPHLAPAAPAVSVAFTADMAAGSPVAPAAATVIGTSAATVTSATLADPGAPAFAPETTSSAPPKSPEGPPAPAAPARISKRALRTESATDDAAACSPWAFETRRWVFIRCHIRPERDLAGNSHAEHSKGRRTAGLAAAPSAAASRALSSGGASDIAALVWMRLRRGLARARMWRGNPAAKTCGVGEEGRLETAAGAREGGRTAATAARNEQSYSARPPEESHPRQVGRVGT